MNTSVELLPQPPLPSPDREFVGRLATTPYHSPELIVQYGDARAKHEAAPLLQRIAELERLCDATYVAQGADAYNHATTVMAEWQASRRAAGLDPGCEGSLCDGLSRLQEMVGEREARVVELEAELAAAREREKRSDTMDQAEKVALLRGLQEVGKALGLQSPSPADLVAAVVALGEKAQVSSQHAAWYRLMRDGQGWPAAVGTGRGGVEPLRGFLLDEACRLASRSVVMKTSDTL